MNSFVNIKPFVINWDKFDTPLNWSRIRKLEILCVLIKSMSWVQNPYEVYYIIKDSCMHDFKIASRGRNREVFREKIFASILCIVSSKEYFSPNFSLVRSKSCSLYNHHPSIFVEFKSSRGSWRRSNVLVMKQECVIC